MNREDLEILINSALLAATTATREMLEEFGDNYPCGFAWVNFKPARGPLVKLLKEMKIGHLDAEGGWSIWNPSGNATQWMDAKEKGARAFANIMRAAGFKFTVRTRLD